MIDIATALEPIEHPCAWRGDDLAQRTDWLCQLSEPQILELERVGA
ncbi:MAG: hypothetical protein JWQ97_161, partial [Phenylobacterium sp.]|nr:hypothetical protein [Phenylobacterium sp.]